MAAATVQSVGLCRYEGIKVGPGNKTGDMALKSGAARCWRGRTSFPHAISRSDFSSTYPVSLTSGAIAAGPEEAYRNEPESQRGR